jgi:hypothetical protein
MSDVVFNSKAVKRNLYRFRTANGFGDQFIAADTLHEASEQLAALGIKADQLAYEGTLLSPRYSS